MKLDRFLNELKESTLSDKIFFNVGDPWKITGKYGGGERSDEPIKWKKGITLPGVEQKKGKFGLREEQVRVWLKSALNDLYEEGLIKEQWLLPNKKEEYGYIIPINKNKTQHIKNLLKKYNRRLPIAFADKNELRYIKKEKKYIHK